MQRPDEGHPELPHGTVTFLLTDVEGSTRLWEDDRGAMRLAVERHDAILATVVDHHGGSRPQEQGEGDSVVAVFTRGSDAIAAALDTQRMLTAEQWPTSEPVRVRMAIHTGEADLRNDRNYGGEAIIRAARLRSLAHGGQVLVSSVTADVVGDRLPDAAGLADLGVHRLKALRQPQRVYQLVHPDLGETFPPLRSLDTARATLPLVLTNFIGRTAELAEGRRLLDEARLVTLVGAGGCGKSRLATRLAESVGDGMDGGVWWVALGSLTDAEAVAHTAMTVLGIGDTRGRTPLERLGQYLAGRRALLVLDSCEHVLAGCRDLAAVLLHACPELTIMTTSREALGLAGETVWRVPPLPANDAVRLFVDRATQARPNFSFSGERAAVIESICERLDGIPLAVELAAARVRMLTPERILAGLDDRFHLLTGGSSSEPRQQTLRASVEWSHDLLSETEQTLLRRLSVFAGGFTLDAAEHVGAGGDVEDLEVLDLLGRLVDRSLVVADDDRYRMLATIGDFAAGRLVAAGEEDAVRARHLACYIELAEVAGAEIERRADLMWLARLEDEHDNLRAALEWALAGNDRARGAQLATALAPFWTGHGHYWEAQTWLRRAADSVDLGPTRARVLWCLGHAQLLGMHVESGYGYTTNDQAAALAGDAGDARTAARAMADLALIESLFASGEAEVHVAEALELARQAGDDWNVANILVTRAFITTLFQDHYGNVGVLAEAIRDAARPLGSPFLVAAADGLEALALVRRGDLRRARTPLEAALAWALDLGDPLYEMLTVLTLADLELGEGRIDAARRLVVESGERLCRSARGRVETMELKLATVLLASGDVTGALDLCESLQEPIQQLAIGYMASQHALVLGRALLEAGQLDRAGETLDAAEAVARVVDNPWLLSAGRHHRAVLLRSRGDACAAEDLHHQSLALRSEHQFWPGVADSLEAIAGIAIAGESWNEGVRLTAAADTWRELSGCHRWDIDERRLRADLDAAHTALGEEGWKATWAEGEALDLQQALAYATRARGERRRPTSGWASLTPTETEVVRLVAEGLSNPEIAARLFVARATVKTHLVHVFSKLDVATRAELAATAARRGV